MRELVRTADNIQSSLWAFAEFHGVIHRRRQEDLLSLRDAQEISSRFSQHIQEGLWKLIPVNEALLRRTRAQIVSAPSDLFVRTADAVHLVTAHEGGEFEVWTNDRHMLAAASWFGLKGRSV